jgi:hypothetical protein
MRKARTITRIVAVYLLLGLVTTWAVAWGLAFHAPGAGSVYNDHKEDYSVAGNAVMTVGYQGWGVVRMVFVAYNHVPNNWDKHDIFPNLHTSKSGNRWISESFVADLSGFYGWGKRRRAFADGRGSPWGVGIDDARGLPFLSHWCAWKVDSLQSPYGYRSSNSPNMMVKNSLVGGFAIPDNPSQNAGVDVKVRALPYYPIWSGLALNTAFYALVFFIAVRTAKAFSRSHRHARGLCPRCKYDREFDYRMPCPECGHHACPRRAAVV